MKAPISQSPKKVKRYINLVNLTKINLFIINKAKIPVVLMVVFEIYI